MCLKCSIKIQACHRVQKAPPHGDPPAPASSLSLSPTSHPCSLCPATVSSCAAGTCRTHVYFTDSALASPHLRSAGPENQMATSTQEPSLTTLYAALQPRCRPFIYPTFSPEISPLPDPVLSFNNSLSFFLGHGLQVSRHCILFTALS